MLYCAHRLPKKLKRRPHVKRVSRTILESMESRVLLSGLPDLPVGLPTIGFTGGSVKYDSTTGILTASVQSTLPYFRPSEPSGETDAINNGSLTISIKLDSSGNLFQYPGGTPYDGAGPNSPADLTVSGTLTYQTFAPTPFPHFVVTTVASGTLLVGHITSFAYSTGDSGDDLVQFGFQLDGGALYGSFPEPFLAGISEAHVAHGTFANGFGTNFSSSIFQGSLGSVPTNGGGSTPIGLTTTPNFSSLTLSSTTVPPLKDSATLTGGNNPTGSILFNLYGSNGTSPVDSETVTVNGSGNYSTLVGYTLPSTGIVAGTYLWVATYSGDANNFSISDTDSTNEMVVISPASPAITTTPSLTNVTLGTSTVTLNDTAVLSGGYAPTGTITFTLVGPGGVTLDTETATVSGNNTYSTSTGYTLPANAAVTGTYQWNASYSGDSNNATASDFGNPNEQIVVSPASPAINTTPSLTNVTLGTSTVTLNDTAVLSGGYNATGSISFTLVGPNSTVPVDTETVPVNGNGSYTTPTGFTLPTNVAVTGTYQWNASYSGDNNNASANDFGNPNEQVVISPASPTINTVAGPTVVIGSGTNLSDTAVLGGGYHPTGTVTFTLTGPGNTVVYTDVVTINGDNTYDTSTGTNPGGYLPTATGAYLWSATYSGDSNNSGASDNGVNENQTVSSATPLIVTAQQPLTATVGSSIADKATVSGGFNPSGTVTFKLYNNSSGTGPGLFSDIESLSGGVATSAGYPTTATGTDYWVATYNGDSNNNPVTSPTNAEPATVNSATPLIVTTQQPLTATVGSSIADLATVSGGFNPTGTVTFKLYNNSSGTGPALFTDIETLSGGVATSAGYPTTATGTDYWVATYNGDSNNNPVTSPTTAEPVTLTLASPTINTVQQPAIATVGSSIADLATVSGGFNPTGTVTFKLYNNSSGTGTALFTDIETLSGGTATSKGYTTTATGTDYWVATYNGDSNNNAVTSPTTAEPATVNSATPLINTTQQPTTATVGSSIADLATVSGGFNPTGTVTFKLYNNSTGTGTPLFTDTETLSGGTATSKGYNAIATGTDYWVATYNGDSNNNAVTSPTTAEPVTINSATPLIVTTQQPLTATVGSSIADKATVSGGFNPTGTVTFKLYNNSSGTGPALFTDTETLSGGVATSAGYPTAATGTDYWVATYNGDSNNNPVTSPTNAEPATVNSATPLIVTTQQPLTATVGSSIADKATVSGGFNPTGTVTFKLYNNSSGTGTALFTDIETLSGGVATSAGYPTAATGTDYWVATYNGDGNNNPVTSGAALEPVTVNSATPLIVTSQQPTTATVGSSIADLATVSGGFNPTGTVTFKLYNNSTATGTPLFTDANEPLSSGGTATSKGYTATAAGTDYWVATYNGDSNNNAVTSPTTAEPVTVNKATPSLITTATLSSATYCGTALPQDKAVLSAGYNISGGNLVFTLTAPNGAVVDTQTIAVTGAGTYTTSNTHAATQVGTYTWTVTYSGDALNLSVHDQGGSAEQLTTGKATPVIATNASITCGGVVGTGVISDSVTVSGGFNPTGTLTFKLKAPDGTTSTVGTLNITGDGTFSSPTVTSTEVGTYTWTVSYSGDSFNNSAVDNGAYESVTTIKDTPSLSTTPGGSVVLGSGVKLTDSATLSGGDIESGSLTFSLYSPSNSVVYTDVVAVSGDGSYTTASGTSTGSNVPTVTGTYQWVVTYSGDANNNSALSAKGNEPEIVTTTPITISGTKYLDQTGNGFSADDTGLSGITIRLYRESNGSSGLQTSGSNADALVTSTTTASNGTYSFTNLVAGTTYYVQEVVPTVDVQTGGGPNGAAGSTYYTICTLAGQTYSGNNFDDYVTDNCSATNVCFKLTPPGCSPSQSHTVTDLRGNTVQGETVTVTFTVTMANDTMTLVSYTAPGPAFDSTTAYQQQIFDVATGTFSPGTYSLTVQIPNCYYQVDFVCDSAIDNLGPANYGPDSNNIFYTAEDRLISADNGGTQACTMPAIKAKDFGTIAFWNAAHGQSLINQLNGGSSAKVLGNWLASNFPQLYGSQVDSTNPYEKNLTGATNAAIATFYNTLYNSSGLNKTYAQIMATALAAYATDPTLAGGTYSASFGFNYPANGTGLDDYNVGTNGTLLGLTNNKAASVLSILAGADDLAISTTALNANLSALNTVFNGINTAGNITNAAMTDQGLAYTPAQVRDAYGINSLSLDGTGQTIAIVSAYDDPAIFQAVDSYDAQFGITDSGPTLSSQYGAASSFLTVLNQSGTAGSLPDADPTGAWEVEAALDVEWAHAMAPGANIVLVEANSQSLDDMMNGVASAAALPGVSVVSMSWGMPEGQSVFASDEAQYDSYMTTPAGHQGVTFVASTGDYGSADPEYPAFSSNVMAVGGTSLYLNANNSYNVENGWGGFSDSAGTMVGSGGGTSLYEPEPAFQSGVQSTGFRSTPDVSMVADPSTGAWISDPYNNPDQPFEIVGGTSLAAPSWAGLMALVNQGRVAAGETTLNSVSSTDAQQGLYSLPQADFNQILTGTNGGFNAGAGYNMVTGLGSPIATRLVPDLVNYQPSSNPVSNPISISTIASSGDSDAPSAPSQFGISNAIVVKAAHLGAVAEGRFDGTTGNIQPFSPATVLTTDAATALVSSHFTVGSQQGGTTTDVTTAPMSANQRVSVAATSDASMVISAPVTTSQSAANAEPAAVIGGSQTTLSDINYVLQPIAWMSTANDGIASPDAAQAMAALSSEATFAAPVDASEQVSSSTPEKGSGTTTAAIPAQATTAAATGIGFSRASSWLISLAIGLLALPFASSAKRRRSAIEE